MSVHSIVALKFIFVPLRGFNNKFRLFLTPTCKLVMLHLKLIKLDSFFYFFLLLWLIDNLSIIIAITIIVILLLLT